MVCGLAVLLAGAADLAACVPKAGACVRAAFALAVQTSLALAGALFRGAAEVLNAYVAFFPLVVCLLLMLSFFSCVAWASAVAIRRPTDKQA